MAIIDEEDLVPQRQPPKHKDLTLLGIAELEEYEAIKHSYLHKNYEYIIEATHQKKSIPSHAHLHLIVARGLLLA